MHLEVRLGMFGKKVVNANVLMEAHLAVIKIENGKHFI
jgi:hypothetical protein